MQNQESEQQPIVWAIASTAPRIGCSVTASAIAGMALLFGHDTALLRPGWWEIHPHDSCSEPLPGPGEIEALYARLNVPFFYALHSLFVTTRYLFPMEQNTRLWVLDLGYSRSHAHWDLFWAADLQCLVSSASSHVDQALYSAWQRRLEWALASDDESLHALLKRIGKDKLHFLDLFDYFDSNKLRHLGTPNPIYQIDLEPKAQKAIHHPVAVRFPRRLVVPVGTLPHDLMSASLLGHLKPFTQILSDEQQVIIARRLSGHVDACNSETVHPSFNQTFKREIYSRIGAEQILNLNLALFDTPTVVSRFSVVDDEHFG